MKKASKLLFCTIVLLISASCTKSIKVTRIVDGDTIIVKPHQVVRIIGIDAPEIETESQKFNIDVKKYGVTPAKEANNGVEAKMALSRLLLGKSVKLKNSENFRTEKLDPNRSARRLYYVELNGDDVAETLLSNGIVRVWDEEFFPKVNYAHEKDSLYKTLQEKAKSDNTGIWGEIKPSTNDQE